MCFSLWWWCIGGCFAEGLAERRRAKKKRVKMMLTVKRYDVCPFVGWFSFSFPADGVSETSNCRIYFRV